MKGKTAAGAAQDGTAPDASQVMASEYTARQDAMAAISRLMAQVNWHFGRHRVTAHNFQYDGKTWSCTGCWNLVAMSVTRLHAKLSFQLVYVNANDSNERTTNPMPKPGIPPGYGPEYKLPHQLDMPEIDLTETPHSELSGYVQGLAAELPDAAFQMVRRQVVEKLLTLGYVEKSEV